MDFKKLLDDYMKQLDCTAKDLAEKSGLSAATISRYRSGDRTPEDGSENFASVLVKLFCNTLFDKYLTVTSLHRC